MNLHVEYYVQCNLRDKRNRVVKLGFDKCRTRERSSIFSVYHGKLPAIFKFGKPWSRRQRGPSCSSNFSGSPSTPSARPRKHPNFFRLRPAAIFQTAYSGKSTLYRSPCSQTRPGRPSRVELWVFRALKSFNVPPTRRRPSRLINQWGFWKISATKFAKNPKLHNATLFWS